MLNATQPAMADPIAIVEFEQDNRLFQMREALTEFCVMEKLRRAWMVRQLNEELSRFDLMVIDCSGYKWGNR